MTTPTTPAPRRRARLWAALAFVLGLSAGFLVRREPPAPALPPELTGPILVFRPEAKTVDALALRPYAVGDLVRGRSEQFGPVPPPEKRWLVSLDGGRVLVSCERVEP